MPDGNALANSIRPANPTGVDQPALRSITFDLALEQLRIFIGMMNHKRSAKTSGERDLRFLAQANLCSRDLGCVPTDELIQCLVRREPRDRRHHPTSIACQQDDVFGMTGFFLRDSI